MAALAGRRPRAADFEPATFSLGLLGRSMGEAAPVAAMNRLQGVARPLAPFFARFDILLTPTLAAPPARYGSLQPSAHELRQMCVVNALHAAADLRRTLLLHSA